MTESEKIYYVRVTPKSQDGGSPTSWDVERLRDSMKGLGFDAEIKVQESIEPFIPEKVFTTPARARSTPQRIIRTLDKQEAGSGGTGTGGFGGSGGIG